LAIVTAKALISAKINTSLTTEVPRRLSAELNGSSGDGAGGSGVEKPSVMRRTAPERLQDGLHMAGLPWPQKRRASPPSIRDRAAFHRSAQSQLHCRFISVAA
jgi:hypothetical protein